MAKLTKAMEEAKRARAHYFRRRFAYAVAMATESRATSYWEGETALGAFLAARLDVYQAATRRAAAKTFRARSRAARKGAATRKRNAV